MKLLLFRRFAFVFAFVAALIPLAASANSGSFIGPLTTVSVVASTVPPNGDVNPYGVAVVKRSVGNLVKGDILVSNFNASSNLQGTGTTIVQISPSGQASVFAQINAASLPGSCPGGVGLTTALVVLRKGWVIVGSLPTSDGTAATAQRGCLIVLDSMGNTVETFSGSLINGPWDMTAFDDGPTAALFITNVLNGTVAENGHTINRGTVVRISLVLTGDHMPRELSRRVIGSGFPERTDPAALVIGPTGLALARDGTLYVADTLENRIASIPNAIFRMNTAGTGQTVFTNGDLNGPLGLTIAPNGDLIAANSGDGNLVEVTPAGKQVATKLVEPGGAGSLFGLVITPAGDGVYFVDDLTNTLNLLH